MLERLRDLFRSAAVSRDLTRGIKAYREGRLAEARGAVDAVCAATEAVGSSVSQRMHRLSVRVIAVTLRAEVAAKQGDDGVARASIEEGFALWTEARALGVKIGPRSIEAFADWETWAREYRGSHGRPRA